MALRFPDNLFHSDEGSSTQEMSRALPLDLLASCFRDSSSTRTRSLRILIVWPSISECSPGGQGPLYADCMNGPSVYIGREVLLALPVCFQKTFISSNSALAMALKHSCTSLTGDTAGQQSCSSGVTNLLRSRRVPVHVCVVTCIVPPACHLLPPQEDVVPSCKQPPRLRRFSHKLGVQ
jgi:hypothetical protein